MDFFPQKVYTHEKENIDLIMLHKYFITFSMNRRTALLLYFIIIIKKRIVNERSGNECMKWHKESVCIKKLSNLKWKENNIHMDSRAYIKYISTNS